MVNDGLKSRAMELYALRQHKAELTNRYRNMGRYRYEERNTLSAQIQLCTLWEDRMSRESKSYSKLQDFTQVQLLTLIIKGEWPVLMRADVRDALKGLPSGIRRQAEQLITEAGYENVQIVNTPEGTLIAVLDKDRG